MLKIENTKDMPQVASFNALIYGPGGVGKTTMASTFPKPLLLDFENGSKYFKSRGIEIDTVQMSGWPTADEKRELRTIVNQYETIIVDPIGTAMQFLIDDTSAISGKKYRTANGDLTMAGWGQAKSQMRNFVTWLISTKRNVVLIAHVAEEKDEGTGRVIKRPAVPTGLKDELVNMVDVVAYFDALIVENSDDEESQIKRVLRLKPGGSYVAKDRTEKLGDYCKPEWGYIRDLLGDATSEKVEDVPQKDETPETLTMEDLANLYDKHHPGGARKARTMKMGDVYHWATQQPFIKVNEDSTLTLIDSQEDGEADAPVSPEEPPVAPEGEQEEPQDGGPKDNFDNSTVEELKSVAKAIGKEIPTGARKADIIKILRSA
jgi:phage nucleotide-binding protein